MEAKHIEVIAQFKIGLNKGLTVLYEAYGKHLYQFSMKNWGLDEDECYEILYKTLETVGKVIARYDFINEKHFTNWLFKIHKNNTLMFVRSKNSKQEIVYTIAEWHEEKSEEESDDAAFNYKENEIINLPASQVYDDDSIGSPLFVALERALQRIDEGDKDILLLRMNNYSYDDIAEMLGIENNQLKVKFLRAKAKVQKMTMEILNEISHEKR